jgi:hypothetical protein
MLVSVCLLGSSLTFFAMPDKLKLSCDTTGRKSGKIYYQAPWQFLFGPEKRN